MRIISARVRGCILILLLSCWATGCATLPEHPPRGPPGKALAPQSDGALAALESRLHPRIGVEGTGSAFYLLNSNEEALRWRIALVDAAEHSLDVQYYFWWGDAAGDLLMKHVIDAADRGVRVRILLDDLSTILENHRKPKVRDWETARLDAHPNIELRLYNVWRTRSMIGRFFEYFGDMSRINQRMHNKLLLADNRAAITGGRNIGDEYFGYAREFNFRDLDLLGIGDVARQASHTFDRFWNSEWVVPASALKVPDDKQDLDAERPAMLRQIEQSTVLQRFPLERAGWQAELEKLERDVHIGKSRVVTDAPAPNAVRHRMPAAIRDLMLSAKRELIISNSYVIPEDSDIQLLRGLTGRGVKVKLLTNSLASQDVPAVNSHYKQWREKLLDTGIELYEARPDAAVRATLADTPPTRAGFMGLHVKALAIDRERCFVGSMNFDPRSAELNSEMGLVVESRPLAAQLAAIIEQDMRPENAWRVVLDDRGGLAWVAGEQRLTRQPARSAWQRVQDIFFMLFPRDLY